MLEDYNPLKFSEFNGWWVRGKPESTPTDHFWEANNIKYLPGGFTVRDGTAIDLEVTGVRRQHNLKLPGQAERKLVLLAGGFLFDSINLLSPILVIPSMTDFSVVTYGYRIYISPHNRVSGLPGQNIYVYDGSGFARPAGANSPRGFTLGVTTSAASGRVETGDHLVAIAWETSSGFVSRPGPETWTRYTATGNFAIDVTNIPIGPSNVIARHILASKKLPANWSGNQEDIEMFFVEEEEGGVINNNVETEKIGVSFFDSQLVRSADYLLDQMENIPAALGMATYKGALITWNENDQPDVIRVSRPFEPESIDKVDGYIEIEDDLEGGIRACVEFRQNLYIHKQTRSYVTQATENDPVFWPWSDIDKGIGTEVYGVGRIVDVPGGTTDIYSLIDRAGIRLFTGTFQNKLTEKIDDFWNGRTARVNKQYLNTAQLLLDMVNSHLYCNLPIDGASSPNCILFGDFKDGLSAEKIKWSLWTFPYSPTSISLDVDENNNPYITIGSINDNIYRMDSDYVNDNNVAIPFLATTALVGDRGGAISQFGGVRLFATGNGSLRIRIKSRNNTKTLAARSLVLRESSDEAIEREFDFESTLACIELSMGLINERAEITEIVLYQQVKWLSSPNNG